MKRSMKTGGKKTSRSQTKPAVAKARAVQALAEVDMGKGVSVDVGANRWRLDMGLAMMGLSMAGMLIGNPLTYALVLGGMILAFTDSTIYRTVAVHRTLSGLARSRVVWILTATLLAFYVGTVTAIKPEYSLKYWVILVVLASCGGLLYHVFSQLNAVKRELFVKWLAWGMLAACLVAIVIAAAEPWARPRGYYGDKPWTETHLRFFSSVLAVVLPLCWSHWLKKPDQGRFDLKFAGYRDGLLLVCFSFVMVLLCAGRSGWLGVVASALVWLGMMWWYHGLKFPSLMRMVGMVFGILVVSGVGYALLYGRKVIEERIGVTIPDRGLGGGRLDIWNLALEHVYDQPLQGLGLNSFRFIPGADYHPHNFIIQLWLETGIVGLGLVMLMLGYMAWRLLRWGRTSVTGACGLAALAGFFVCALTNKSIFNPEWLVIFVITMAFAMAAAKGEADEARQSFKTGKR